MFKLKKRWPAGEKHGTKKRECEKTMAPWAQKTSSCALKLYLSCAYELPCGVSSSANRSFSQVSLQQKFEHFHKRGYYRGRDGEWKQLRKRGKRGGKPKPSKPRQNPSKENPKGRPPRRSAPPSQNLNLQAPTPPVDTNLSSPSQNSTTSQQPPNEISFATSFSSIPPLKLSLEQHGEIALSRLAEPFVPSLLSSPAPPKTPLKFNVDGVAGPWLMNYRSVSVANFVSSFRLSVSVPPIALKRLSAMTYRLHTVPFLPRGLPRRLLPSR